MRRAVAALIGSILGLVLLAPAASAAAPVQIRVSDPVSFELPGGEFCEFDVQVDIEQKFKVILFAGHRGTWIGGLTAGKIVADYGPGSVIWSSSITSVRSYDSAQSIPQKYGVPTCRSNGGWP